MNSILQKFGVIVLASGNSNRMGVPKPWLMTNVRTSFLLSIVKGYHDLGIEDIVVVLQKSHIAGEWEQNSKRIRQYAKVVINDLPELGRLYSLKLGLMELQTPYIFIQNVDNPMVEPCVLKLLTKNRVQCGVAIPYYQNHGGHPVLISSSIGDMICEDNQKYDTLKSVFRDCEVEKVDVLHNSILTNINTPEEYNLFLSHS